MKNDDLNSRWTEFDRKLEMSLQLNKTVLRKMNFEKAGRQLRKPLTSEVLNIVFSTLFAAYLMTLSILMIDLVVFSIPGLMAAFSTITLIVFGTLRIRAMQRLSHVNRTILELQKNLHAFMDMRRRLARSELILSIIPVVTMWPIVLYTGFDIDIYQTPIWLGIFLGICAAAIIPVIIWHERYYRDKIARVEALYHEIEDLETESAG